jgi:YfiH family protein
MRAPPFEQSSVLLRPGLTHGFFGRRGGASTGDFESNNMSMSVGDDAENVERNRAAACEALGGQAASLVLMKQVHSSAVITVTEPPAEVIEADAMVTANPGLLLGILTADCAPILLADPEARVIGAAHAGWKGAAGGIAYATVRAMVALGADPRRIIAAIGPTISMENYEVGPDFAAGFLAAQPLAAHRIVKPEGRREHLDLPGMIADQLRGAGTGLVDDLAICTYAYRERYFSHRRATHEGIKAGRQIALIGLA